MTAPLTLTDALNSYGFAGQLANAIPELRGILDQAMREEWQPAQFNRAVMDSGWWKANADSVRQLATLQATDPATYNQHVGNAASKIRLMAYRMGRQGADWTALALRALSNNWDDEQIRFVIGNEVLGTPLTDGVPTGDAGQIQGHLKRVATNYGVPITDSFISNALIKIQSGMDTIEGFENVLRARAKAQYAHLADQIDAGMTVRDIADPYIATMAQTWEVPETGIDLDSPEVKRALQVRQDDGSWGTKPMWQFVRELKDDPRWESTQNARDEAYRIANRLGKDFGFLS